MFRSTTHPPVLRIQGVSMGAKEKASPKVKRAATRNPSYTPRCGNNSARGKTTGKKIDTAMRNGTQIVGATQTARDSARIKQAELLSKQRAQQLRADIAAYAATVPEVSSLQGETCNTVTKLLVDLYGGPKLGTGTHLDGVVNAMLDQLSIQQLSHPKQVELAVKRFKKALAVSFTHHHRLAAAVSEPIQLAG